ncbi:MAG TPA: DUF4389 domain-containing protein, partial [Dongiaceae bacterium]|nr:DUF4389 domain-containing protein [Dongiaceae bacterium]
GTDMVRDHRPMETAKKEPGEPASPGAGEMWARGLFMLLFVVIYGVLEVVLSAVVIFQFVTTLVARGPNERLLELGRSLSDYVYAILLFLTYNSDEKPYPFAAWPTRPPAG